MNSSSAPLRLPRLSPAWPNTPLSRSRRSIQSSMARISRPSIGHRPSFSGRARVAPSLHLLEGLLLLRVVAVGLWDRACRRVAEGIRLRRRYTIIGRLLEDPRGVVPLSRGVTTPRIRITLTPNRVLYMVTLLIIVTRQNCSAKHGYYFFFPCCFIPLPPFPFPR